jgi:hypothetical protein
MPSLREILNDPNYTNANQATKEAIFNKYAPQDKDYTGANEATQQAIKERFGLAVAAPQPQEEPEEESGFFRQTADIPVGFAKGVTGGVRMIADIFGAGSDTSNTIKGVEDYLGGLLSAQAKRDSKEVSRIMKEAEDKGVADQVIAGVKAFAVAPIDTLTQALGTSAPAIVAGLATTLTGGAPLAVAGVTAGIGAGMGAGAIKGGIYEATKEELLKAKVDPEVAERAATEAQAYGGENLDQILLGAGIGAVAARTGIERAILGKAITKETAKRSLTRAGVEEAVPEVVQAGQEQAAQNIALQRQGFDVPLTRGVYSAATLEGLAGAGLGVGVEAVTRRGAVDEGPRTKEDDQIDALRNLQPEDIGEVVPPETEDAGRARDVRVERGPVERGVPVPTGVDEAAAGVVEPEVAGVGGVGGAAVQPTEGAGALDTTLEQRIVAPTVLDATQRLEDRDDADLAIGILEDEQRRANLLIGEEKTKNLQDALELAKIAIQEGDSRRTFFDEDVQDANNFVDAINNVYAGLEQGTLPYAENTFKGLLDDAKNLKETFTQRIADRDKFEAERAKQPASAKFEYEERPGLKVVSGGKTPAPSPITQEEPSLSATPSASLTLGDLTRLDDEKLTEKFQELQTGTKKGKPNKKYKEYSTALTDMQLAIDELSEFLRQRGVDPTNVANLRGGDIETQNAAALLSALGQDAANITKEVKNNEINYASAKTPEARAGITDRRVQDRLQRAKQTTQAVRDFIQDPSRGTGQIEGLFSTTRQVAEGTRGLDVGVVRSFVDDIVSEWDNAPRIEVVQSITDLPGYMQDQIVRDKVNPQGAYDPASNLVFLISDNLRNSDDVVMTLAHEALGHFGLRSILGDTYTRVMNEIYNGNKNVKAAADKKLKDNTNMSREVAVEEVLAEMAETERKPTPALRRIIDAIRRFARRIKFPLKSVTDGEIQQLVANASRYVRKTEMKFDPFTRGQAQPGGPRAVTGDKAVFDVVKRDARLSDKRIRDLFSTYGYVGENSTNAYIGFVRPKDFLAATTGDAESLAAMRETEFRPLDKEKLAAEINPIFLNVKKQSERFGAPMAAYSEIVQHEGRHRMMALEAAGIEEVPVVFVNGVGSGLLGEEIRNPEIIDRLDLDGQTFNDGSQGPGFTVTDLIPISYNYLKQIKETFGGEADVVFSALPPAAKNLQAVYSQGFKSEAGPTRVNPGNAPGMMEKLMNGRPKWPEVKGKFNLKSLPSLPPSAKQAAYKLMTLRMLKDIVGARIPQVGRAITLSEQMVSERGNIMRDGADVLDKLEALRKEKNGAKQIKLMGELQVQATILEIDPDPTSKFHDANVTLTNAWNTLSPKAQEIYRDMRNFYETQIDGMVDDMKARVDRNFPKDSKGKENPKAIQLKKEIDEEFGPSKRKGPYFPLRRFGQYWFQVDKGEDKEFYMFESVDDRNYWMEERKKELVAANRQDLIDGMASGDSLRDSDNSLNNALASEPIMQKVEKLVDDATKGLTDPQIQMQTVEDLKDGLKQLQYLLLPSTNLRKAFIHRKGIAGASADAGRVFSTSVVNIAYQRARVKYAEQFYSNIDNAYAFLEGAPNTEETRTLRDLVNELNSRSPHILGMEPSGISDKVANGITQFSFLWLLTAPASSIINVFGAATVGSSYIGARYGYPETFARMTKYGGKYFATAPKVMQGNTVFPTLDKSVSLNPVEKAAYDRFLHDNAVDVSLTQDIMGLSQAPYEEYSTAKFKLVQGVSSIFHHSERMSREVMNMAAFDLAYADNVKKGMAPGVDGPAFNAAIETAKDLTFMSIGDFSRSGKPPVLTKPAAKVLFQFKQYSLLMTYNILRN